MVVTSFTQDSAGRLTIVAHTRPAPAGSLPVSYSYKYFADGRLREEFASTDGTTVYTTDQPCFSCSKELIQAGVVKVFYARPWQPDRRVASDFGMLQRRLCAEQIRTEYDVVQRPATP